MRISKLLSGSCAAALLLGSLALRAQDNPAQAAARAALMKQIGEMNAHATPPANQGTPPATVATPSKAAMSTPSTPRRQPKVVATLPPAETQAAFAPGGASDNAAQAAARAALMKQIGEMNAQQAQAANPGLAPMVMKPSGPAAEQPAQRAKVRSAAPSQVATAPAKTQPTPVRPPRQRTAWVPTAENSSLFTPVPPPSNPKIRGGVAIAVSSAPPTGGGAQIPERAASQPPSSASVNSAGKELGFAPIKPPPPPVSAQQEAELELLLGRYKANQITPEEYQRERAAILAQH